MALLLELSYSNRRSHISELLQFRVRVREKALSNSSFGHLSQNILNSANIDSAIHYLDNARWVFWTKNNRIRGLCTIICNVEKKAGRYIANPNGQSIEDFNKIIEEYFCSQIQKFMHWHDCDLIPLKDANSSDGDVVLIRKPDIKKLKKRLLRNRLRVSCDSFWQQGT